MKTQTIYVCFDISFDPFVFPMGILQRFTQYIFRSKYPDRGFFYFTIDLTGVEYKYYDRSFFTMLLDYHITKKDLSLKLAFGKTIFTARCHLVIPVWVSPMTCPNSIYTYFMPFRSCCISVTHYRCCIYQLISLYCTAWFEFSHCLMWVFSLWWWVTIQKTDFCLEAG